MATEAGFVDQNFKDSELQPAVLMHSSGTTNKRKRVSFDQDHPNARGAPSTRPSHQQQFNMHDPQQSDPLVNAPTANMNDPISDSFLASQHSESAQPNTNQFDLSALAQQGDDAQIHQEGSLHGQTTSSVNVDTAAAAAALNQHYHMNVPAHSAESFLEEQSASTEQPGFTMEGNFESRVSAANSGDDRANDARSDTPGKPQVGTEQWHKVRKDNHKEVERRRRETINDGINELSKIVPGCEKNKGSILSRAVSYIAKLHEDATTNIDKWTYEKCVTEQVIAELSRKIQRAYEEKNAWKRIASEAGVDVTALDLKLAAELGDMNGDGEGGGEGRATDVEARLQAGGADGESHGAGQPQPQVGASDAQGMA